MHASVMAFLGRVLGPPDIAGFRVLEVGSQDVNGSPREAIIPLGPSEYVGADAYPGKGVDVVVDGGAIVERFGPASFDVVVSTEMLEHARDWRAPVAQMKAVLRTSGLLVVTTRGPGFPFHAFPDDYWRFTIDDFRAIFADMSIEVLEPDVPTDPGVLMRARKRSDAPTVDLDAISVAPVGQVTPS